MSEDIFQLGIKALIVNSEGHILLLKVNEEMLKGFSGDPYWDIPGAGFTEDQRSKRPSRAKSRKKQE